MLFWGLLAVVAAGVIVLSSPYWFPSDWLRRRLDEELEKTLPVEASVGELSIRLGLGLRVRWRDVKLVSEAEGARLEVVVESGEGEVPLGSLFGGEVRVPTVTLESVRARLRMGPEGLRPLLTRWQTQQKKREAQAEAEVIQGKGRRQPVFPVKQLLATDLILSLVDEQGRVRQSTPSIDLAVAVKSLRPADVTLNAHGQTLSLQVSLVEARDRGRRGSVSRRARVTAHLRGVNLEGISDSLRLLVSPQTPRVASLLREGKIDFTREGDLFSVEASATLDHLVAESPGTGSLSTTRLQVPQARLTVRPGKDHLECTLEKLAVEADAFDLSLPAGAAPSVPADVALRATLAESALARPLTGGFHISGRRLSGALKGSATLSPEQVIGSVQALEPIHLVEARLTASGESEPLAAAAEAWLSGATADVTFGPGEPPTVAVSGELNFKEAAANGLLARLALPVSAAPVEGRVDFRTTSEGATGEAFLHSASLSVKGDGREAAVGPWGLRTRFSVTPAKSQLDLSEARWSSERVSLTGSLAGAPIVLEAPSSALSGSLRVLPQGRGWSLAGSADASLGPLSLRAEDGEAVTLESLQVTGSAQATASDGKLTLAALETTASVVGGRANERVRSWLPPRLRSFGVALAGDGQVALRYDGRFLEVQASGTGREVELQALKLLGPSPLRLDGLRGELSLRLAPDLSEVILHQCQLESPEFEASARGVVRWEGATYSLQLVGRLATSWSALGPSWLALAEALPAKLHDALVRFSFAGQASLEDVVITGPLNQLTLAAEVNLDGSAVRFDEELVKEAGTRGRMPLRLVLGERVRLEDLAVELEGLPRLRVAGDTDWALSQAKLQVTIEQLEQTPLKEVRPELAQLALSGGLSFEAFLENVRESPTGRAQFHFDHLGVEVVGPEPVRLEVDGTVAVTPASITCEDLRVTVDGSDLAVSGRLEGYLGLLARLGKSPDESTEEPAFADADQTRGLSPLPVAPQGLASQTLPRLRVDVRTDVLDVTRFERALFGEGPPGESPATVVELVLPTVVELQGPQAPKGSQTSLQGPQAPKGSQTLLVPAEGAAAEWEGAERPDRSETSPAAAAQVAIDREAIVDWLSRWLPRLGTELAASGSVEVGELRSSRATLTNFKAAWELTDGVLRSDVCQAGMSGGEFDASGTEVHLDRWPPSYTCIYQTFDLEPDPFVVEMVSRRFPGLTLFGRMDDEGTLEGLASADPAQWASSVSGGTWSTLTDGVLVMPLLIPDYVRQLFPSFKTSTYHFSRMTNEATIKEGVWHNIMKFDGYPEIYVAGTTDPEGRVNYEAGLRLLKTVAGPAGPMVADVGRLPVAHFTGRIQGTEFVALEGNFVTLTALVGRLLADGLYGGLKKGVLDLGYLRSFQQSVPVPGLDVFIGGLDFFLDVTVRLIPGLGKEKPAPAP